MVLPLFSCSDVFANVVIWVLVQKERLAIGSKGYLSGRLKTKHHPGSTFVSSLPAFSVLFGVTVRTFLSDVCDGMGFSLKTMEPVPGCRLPFFTTPVSKFIRQNKNRTGLSGRILGDILKFFSPYFWSLRSNSHLC